MKTENQKTEKGIINSTALSINEKLKKETYQDFVTHAKFINEETEIIGLEAKYPESWQRRKIEMQKFKDRIKALENLKTKILIDNDFITNYHYSLDKKAFIKEAFNDEYLRIQTPIRFVAYDFI